MARLPKSYNAFLEKWFDELSTQIYKNHVLEKKEKPLSMTDTFKNFNSDKSYLYKIYKIAISLGLVKLEKYKKNNVPKLTEQGLKIRNELEAKQR